MIHFIDKVDISPAITGSFQVVDVSAYVSVEATGVILHARHASFSGSFNRSFGAIFNGASNTRTKALYYTSPDSCTQAIIKCDIDKKIKVFIEVTNIIVELIAYTEDEAVLFTDPVDISLVPTGIFTDIDITAQVVGSDIPLMAIIEYHNTALSQPALGFRDDGSSDSRIHTCYGGHIFTFVVGVTSNIWEGYIGNVSQDFYLIGYFISGVNKITNATDESLGSTGSLIDLPVSLGSNKSGGFFEIVTSIAGKTFSLQANDNIPACGITSALNNKFFAIVPCDINGISEGQINNLSVDFFLLGTIDYVLEGNWMGINF